MVILLPAWRRWPRRFPRWPQVTVVAPERDRSGASNSLTLDRPLMLRQSSNGFYYVNGTPTDCVHLAVTGMLDHLPDMVISGINHGANMGDDTIYSGTVAAATEGFLLGVPAIAVSLVSMAIRAILSPPPGWCTRWWSATSASPLRSLRCSTSMCRMCLTRHCRAAKSPAWASATRPSRW